MNALFDAAADLILFAQKRAAALNVGECPECRVKGIVPYVGGKSYEINPCNYHKESVCACGCGCIGWCGVDTKADDHNDDAAIGMFDREKF